MEGIHTLREHLRKNIWLMKIGCLLDSHTPGEQEFPPVLSSGLSILVHLPIPWPVLCTVGLYQDPEVVHTLLMELCLPGSKSGSCKEKQTSSFQLRSLLSKGNVKGVEEDEHSPTSSAPSLVVFPTNAERLI